MLTFLSRLNPIYRYLLPDKYLCQTQNQLYFYYNCLFSQDRSASIDIAYSYLSFNSIVRHAKTPCLFMAASHWWVTTILRFWIHLFFFFSPLCHCPYDCQTYSRYFWGICSEHKSLYFSASWFHEVMIDSQADSQMVVSYFKHYA